MTDKEKEVIETAAQTLSKQGYRGLASRLREIIAKAESK